MIPGIVLVLALVLPPNDGKDVAAAPPQAADETDLWERDTLSGEWGGKRPSLADEGFEMEFVYAGEVFGNVSGGVRSGARYEGLFTMGLDVELRKAVGWPGARFHASSFWIEGDGLNGEHVPDALTAISNIDGVDRIRLFEVWLEQAVLDESISLRFGVLAADEEFMVSEHALVFMNSTFGPPSGPTVSMPMPIYPVGAPGVRFRVEPVGGLFVQAGVFDGDPGSEEFNDTGMRIRLEGSEGILSMVEAGYGHSEALPGVVKVGAMVHSGTFPDFASGRTRDRNYGVYGVVEQTLFVEPDMAQGLAAFFRTTLGPEDRSLVPVYWDGGLHYTGLLPGRDEDVIGFAVAYLGISDDYADAQPNPSEWDAEIVFELTYQVAVAPWLTVQPDVQYLVHPGGTSANDDAMALGVRFEVVF